MYIFSFVATTFMSFKNEIQIAIYRVILPPVRQILFTRLSPNFTASTKLTINRLIDTTVVTVALRASRRLYTLFRPIVCLYCTVMETYRLSGFSRDNVTR